MTFIRKIKPERTCKDFKRCFWKKDCCRLTLVCNDRVNYLSRDSLCTGISFFPYSKIVYEQKRNDRRINSIPEATCANCGKTWYGWALKFKNEKCECGNDLNIVTLNGVRIVGDLEEEN